MNRVLIFAGCMLLPAHSVCGGATIETTVSRRGDGSFVLAGARLRVEVAKNGQPRRLTRLGGDGSAAWSLPLGDERWWWTTLDGRVWDAATARVVSVTGFRETTGSSVVAVYDLPTSKMSVHVSLGIRASEGDRLRASYVIVNDGDNLRDFRFYFSVLHNLPRGPKKQIVYPFRSGQVFPTESLRFTERPAPGHLWMQWMGYLDGPNGLLLHPEDRNGYLKFADFWPQTNTTLRMGWCDVVVVGPHERYVLPFDYVIRPLPTPDGFQDLCRAYAEWGRKQAWFVSAADKLRRRPALARMVETGIVKMVGLGALSKYRDRYVPVTTFLPREEKDRMAGPGDRVFDRFLATARRLEQLYDIRPAYRFDGWWGRFDSMYPFVLPVRESMGGNERFEWFCRENRHDGRLVILHDNPVQYDEESPRFDPEHMAKRADLMSRCGQSIWSGNRLVSVSPRLAIADNLDIVFQLRRWGISGVFWDVIGASSPTVDYNPLAHYPCPGRDSYYQALLTLFGALRNAAPEMILGTEAGQEMMLPYFDYTDSYGWADRSKGAVWAPLNELVYGDAFVNAVGIDGNNRTYDDETRVIRRLYGAILGHDGRGAWTKQYNPVVQQIFEVNRVISVTATQRMQQHLIDPSGWRASLWPGAVVVGNTGARESLDVLLKNTPLGSLRVGGLRRFGFVIVNKDGFWVAWGCRELVRDGRPLIHCSNPDSLLVRNKRGLTLASYGFHGQNGTPDLTPWRVSGSGVQDLPWRRLVAWPGGASVRVRTLRNGAVEIPAPGVKRTLKIRSSANDTTGKN